MTSLVRWQEQAENELVRILDYIERESPQAALAMALAIRGQTSSLLSEHPRIGRAGRVRGTRELIIARTPFIVIYRIRGDAIEIIHVLHGAQQWTPNF